jgi:hypothetical protein
MGNTDYFTDITTSNFTFDDYCAPTIIDFNPKISTAGTGAELTILGTGFGKTAGELRLIDANKLGTSKRAKPTILSWSDNKIQCLLHSRAPDTTCVGTGKIQVINTLKDSASTSSDLLIEYSILNYTYGDQKYPSFPVLPFEDNNGNAKEFLLTYYVDFPEARAVIMKAIRDISCNTAINFTYDTIPRDVIYGIEKNRYSTITLGHDDYMDKRKGTLAYTNNFPEGELCSPQSGNPWSITYESDIIIDNARNWNFDTTGSDIPEGQIPFYEVVLHELSHAAGLDHVCTKSYQILWPYLDDKGRLPEEWYSFGKHPDETVSQGVDWMFTAKEKIGYNCNGTVAMQRSKCNTEVGIDDKTFYESIQLYNNPTADGTVSLRFKLLKPEQVSFKLVDLMGRTLQEQQKDYTNTEVDEALDLGKQPTGVYGLIVQKGKDVQMFKIIKQ